MYKPYNIKNHTNSIIGVIGTGHGAGTTHFCFMLAVFMGVVKGHRVAVVEQNESGCFGQAVIILDNFTNSKINKISKYISIYKKSDDYELTEIISMGFDYVIIDYGCNYDTNKSSFLMCPEKIVIGSLSWWKIHLVIQFIIKNGQEKSFRHWIFLTGSPVMEGIKYIKKEFDINILIIPYEPDPFCLSDRSLKFFQYLAERLL